jgi:excisionase family DNA binding protein
MLKGREVAQLFNVSQRAVVDWAKTGKLSAVQTPGGHWRFRESVVMEALKDRFPDEV